MFHLKSWFRGKHATVPKDRERERAGRDIERLLDREALAVFRAYRDTLLEEPIAYMVHAVWGTRNGGIIDPAQQEIHSRLASVFDEGLRLFAPEGLNPPQQAALNYLLRGLFISKITFMIEFFRNRAGLGEGPREDPNPDIARMAPAGHA